MYNDVVRRCFSAGLALALAAPFVSPGSAADSKADTAVDPRLRAIVEKHLRTDPNYRPGDLLTRGNVEPIFNELIELGAPPTDDPEGLYSVFLRDGDYLAQTLRLPQGRVFMRRIADVSGAYDFLERLSRTPTGRSWIEQLVAAENGAELLADLLTDEGLRKAAEALGPGPGSDHLGLPTGRIHTEAELLVRLQRNLEAQTRKTKQPKQ